MTITNNKILVGLSGGVDSSTTVLLLQRQGYEVVTASILFSSRHEREVNAAKQLAKELNTKHYILDAQREFNEKILTYFCNSYLDGQTPNPCILCNPLVKFKTLTAFADELGIESIATGHYSGLIKIDGHTLLASAENKTRDQSYMLYRLPQSILKRVAFPLSALDKSSVRNLARDKELSSAEKPDSQELCFCDNYVDFLQSRGAVAKSGNFILPNKKTIQHKGSYRYAVGQRKGLSISYSHPLYVNSIEQNGDVVLTDRDSLFKDTIAFDNAVFNPFFNSFDIPLYCKIRSTATPVKCDVTSSNGSLYTVKTNQPVFAPSKGQSIVLYTEINSILAVVGGGIIT